VTRSSGAIFLDRDGTVNEEANFLSSPDQVRLIPGAAEAIREARANGFKIIIVSNQAGVGRGLLTEEDVRRVNARLEELLAADGVAVDGIFYCPHLPAAPDLSPADECSCRKPKPGMLLRARDELGIDLSRSFIVGDKLIDVETGHNGGARSVLVRTGYGSVEEKRIGPDGAVPEHVADDLLDAVRYITSVTSTNNG